MLSNIADNIKQCWILFNAVFTNLEQPVVHFFAV